MDTAILIVSSGALAFGVVNFILCFASLGLISKVQRVDARREKPLGFDGRYLLDRSGDKPTGKT